MEKKSLNASQKMKKTPIGEIPVDWEILSLSKIANITTGKKDVNEGNANGIYPFFTCSQKEYRIDEYSFDSEAVIVAGNAYFNVKYYIGKFDAYQRTYVIDGFKNNLAKYVFYVLSKDLKRLTTNNQGSAVKYIKLKDLTDFQFPLPPINERQKIINVLTTIDSIIEKTHAVIDQTQTLKKGLMQELFTRGIPGRHKRFKKTEIGVIPEEWEVKFFGEIFAFLSTGNNPRSDLSEHGGVNYIHYGDIHAKWKDILDFSQDITPMIDISKVKNMPLIKDGDLIMVDASEDYEGLGKSVEVRNIKNRHAVAGLHTFLLRGHKNIIADGFKRYIQSMNTFKNSLRKISTGISVYGISKNNLKRIQLGIPSLNEQSRIAFILSAADETIENNRDLVDSLQHLKSALMQVLLTGKVRVKA